MFFLFSGAWSLQISNFVYCINAYRTLSENILNIKPCKWVLCSFWRCSKINVIAIVMCDVIVRIDYRNRLQCLQNSTLKHLLVLMPNAVMATFTQPLVTMRNCHVHWHRPPKVNCQAFWCLKRAFCADFVVNKQSNETITSSLMDSICASNDRFRSSASSAFFCTIEVSNLLSEVLLSCSCSSCASFSSKCATSLFKLSLSAQERNKLNQWNEHMRK